MSISLDLMELDGKATPVAIVGEILRQNPQMPFPVPLEALAAVSGIERIEDMTTEGFEGMLMTNPEKSRGVILVKANGNHHRRRFTIGHELGHYFLPWHRQTKFSCTAENIKDPGGDFKAARGQEMEAEANAFASELLMPSREFTKRLRSFGEPDIAQVVELSSLFGTSIEASARRLMNLSDYPVAFVFSRHDTIRYWTKGPEFPYLLRVRNGQPLPRDCAARTPGDGIADMDEVDSATWLSEERGRLPDTIFEQTLYQQDGYKVTLLYVEDIPEDDED
ncbi:ImmA/IrrE family metallo-endopeptidase [Aromatoleum toluclasticum]|uniref:ImmA/IrrE family metallo-endopeptidase n=1 Tax=Aromatoleum toluclasticum TaxID=92003 RepID=UPI00058BA3F3|nr:ImmA/IrrE family metallo-endopeptidase [Aromatoleum toluclasticum]